MQIGLLGLGRMGGNMSERLLAGGHAVIAADRNAHKVAEQVAKGAKGAENLAAMVRQMTGRRAIWIMIPSGAPTEAMVLEAATLLAPGDVIIDGGNSFYQDSIRRGNILKEKGIHYLDAGTSGGIWGLTEGYCLMIGGEDDAFAFCEPVFRTLAPPEGYLHVGPIGAGHYTKMVHNGIEYAMMQAYAEGFEILKQSAFPLDLPAISKLWEHGTVIRSWLLELTTLALRRDPELANVRAYVEDSGEGRWTVEEAIHTGVPAYTIAAALFARFASRQDNAFGLRLLGALRNEFGGHPVMTAEGMTPKTKVPKN
jgi:6-phosphogluconate dehydrogenase